MSTGELEANPATRPIEVDTLSYEYISGLQQQFTRKIYNPITESFATERLIQEREKWRQLGTITVFTSGVFDMLHLDHSGYLLHTKALGAAELYRREAHNTPWGDLSAGEQQVYTNKALSFGDLRLIVSIDGDKSVAIRKGFNPEKGNAVRPVYAWQTRALQVASQCYVDPANHSYALHPTVDAVTIHGPDDFDAEHPHSSHFDLVETLQPDVWAIFGESQNILDEAPRRLGLGSVALRCIMDGKGPHYYEDAVIGKMSTTNIVNRIKAGE